MASDLKENQLRVAYLTINDPHDRRSWSGTEYAMARALEKQCGNLFYVGPVKETTRKFRRRLSVALKRLTGKTVFFNTLSFSQKLGKICAEKIRTSGCNVIFAPAQSMALAYMDTGVPIVYLSDATVRLLENYYDEFSGVVASHQQALETLESRAITKAARLIYPSSWAATSAIQDYGAQPSRVSVIPFGASLESSPARDAVVRVPPADRCRLLFVGREWERKGGAIALAAFDALKKMGIPAELSIVGCQPPSPVADAGVKVFPFLNKNVPEELEQLRQLYASAHFFILPTRAECFSIALCEANASAIPVLTTRTGGLTELVKEGVNGFLFPLEAQGAAYAEKVQNLMEDRTRYSALRESSRSEFENRLNWDSWGKRVKSVLVAALADQTP